MNKETGGNPVSARTGGAANLKRGGSPGRPAGRQNNATLAAKALARDIVTDSKYLKKLRTRALRGQLKPAVEALLWYYAFGKPTETLDIDVRDNAIVARLLAGRARVAADAKSRSTT